MKPQLTVYKASAGSGKTFTLAKEYMTLVIDNPMSYRTILAVTFTNKATEEMKMRILSQLYGLAHRLPESASYLLQIHQALPHLSESQIAENAATALSLLVHNYNYFRVETIDTFFQSVLRNLARELELTANLRIELNDTQIEQQAVDQLIESLRATDVLLFRILAYIKENIADDKGWNIIGQIKKFGEHIFKDYYKDNADRLNECLKKEGFVNNYKNKIIGLQNKAKEVFVEVAESFFDTLEANGYSVSDLSNGKSGIAGFFLKLKRLEVENEEKLYNKTYAKCLGSTDGSGWLRASDCKPGTPLCDVVLNDLLPILRFADETSRKWIPIYKTASLTVRHLNQLSLLSDIDHKVREMNKDANRFLLSDTQTLLNSLIEDNDSPFIFEKIGAQLEHVMIDEFQDTSTVQWKNFRVLLEETMSREDAGNLIVGDVKQSIYRWRSGDWRLLNNIEAQFDNGRQRIDVKNLATNWRSDRNVIDFNNAFFCIAAESEYNALKEGLPTEAVQLKNAYADVEQQVPNGKPAKGLVRINLLNSESKEEDMQRLTLDTVNELHDQGVEYSKMAILVRNRRSIQGIADYFMNNSDKEIPLVSDEAFRLDASQAVCTLVTALYLIVKPADKIAQATIDKFAMDFGSIDSQTLIAERENLQKMPLYDLVERLFILFRMGSIKKMQEQNAYICAFYDQLSSYLADNSSDIESFLEEWDSSIHDKSIHSDAIDGIRLITIHKSKGLEFDTVIIPSCDWELEKTRDVTLWCTPRETPFDELPLVPIDFSSMMKGTIYEADYQYEHLQNIVDNLNLLYVAFTRAGKNLVVMGRRRGDRYRSGIIEQTIADVANRLSANEYAQPMRLEGEGTKAKEADILFEYGALHADEEEKTKNKEFNMSANVFTAPVENIDIDIRTTDELPEFRQSNQSRDFVVGDDEEELRKHYIKMGTVLHALFSTIRTHEDIDRAIRQLELDGVIYDENISRESLVKMIRKRLESPQVSDWFSDRWNIFSECSILSVENGKAVEHRPDRVLKDGNEIVVIDFKFGKEREEYYRQVREYMDLLQGMGDYRVRGYLWFVYSNKVVEVNNN